MLWLVFDHWCLLFLVSSDQLILLLNQQLLSLILEKLARRSKHCCFVSVYVLLLLPYVILFAVQVTFFVCSGINSKNFLTESALGYVCASSLLLHVSFLMNQLWLSPLRPNHQYRFQVAVEPEKVGLENLDLRHLTQVDC